MDSTNKAEAISPAPSAVSPPPGDEAAAKAILEVLEGMVASFFQKPFSQLNCLQPLPVTRWNTS
jgi:hypothetical protein